jgi:hypothetical protein
MFVTSFLRFVATKQRKKRNTITLTAVLSSTVATLEPRQLKQNYSRKLRDWRPSWFVQKNHAFTRGQYAIIIIIINMTTVFYVPLCSFTRLQSARRPRTRSTRTTLLIDARLTPGHQPRRGSDRQIEVRPKEIGRVERQTAL